MKNKKIEWFCRKCGKTHNLEREDDDITTKMFCPKCNIRMYRVKTKQDGRK